MKQWNDPFKPTPEGFHLRVEQTLSGLEEKEMKHSTKFTTAAVIVLAVILLAATGFAALDDEAEHFRSQAFDFWKIGDNFQVRKIFNAMREGYNAGAHI